MNKYDFGYELTDPVNLWAFNTVNEGSTILEVGSSNGRLTKHLKEEKNCTIDIIEINYEAGQEAAVYARNAYIGKDGNVEDPNVLTKIRAPYDYIIFLDVLEHLYHPEKVLRNMRSLLTPEGKIIASVPNIAHNSILIELLNNRFEYTQLGILDNTHIHFYTEESFSSMIHQCGYYICDVHAVQHIVGDTEIKNSYDNVSTKAEEVLRTRENSDVYQIQFVLTKEAQKCEPTLHIEPLDYTGYLTEFYANEDEESAVRLFVNPTGATIKVNLQEFKIAPKVLRWDPMENACMIRLVEAVAITATDEKPLQIAKSNAWSFTADRFVFYDDDPQIYFTIDEGTESIQIRFESIVWNAELMHQLEKFFPQSGKNYDELLHLTQEMSVRMEYYNAFCHRMQTENTRLAEQSKTFEIQANITKQQNLSIVSDAAIVKEENEILKKRNAELADKLTVISALEEMLENIKTQLSDYASMVDHFQKENSFLIEKCETYETQVNKIADQNVSMESKISELNEQLKVSREQAKELREQYEECTIELNMIKSKMWYRIMKKLKG